MKILTPRNNKDYYDYLAGIYGMDEKLDIRVHKKDAIPNPILIGTPITSLIPPQEIYQDLSNYISSLNDIEIIDTRSDIQKAESAGFDRKTSFRNIK